MAKYKQSRSNLSSSFKRHSHHRYSAKRSTQDKKSKDNGLYPAVKTCSSFTRQHMTPDVFEGIKEKGPWGQVIGLCGDKLSGKLVHKISFGIAGLFYNKNKDHPAKGSLLYWIASMLIVVWMGAIVRVLAR